MIQLLIRKLHLRESKLIARNELEAFCREIKIDYNATVKYLLYNRYLARILRGIFYVRSIEERKLGKTDINHLEAIKEAMRIKGVYSWYFGLETALKLNNVTHEYFAVDTVISDVIFRAKPIDIMGRKVAFIKIKPELLVFGVKKGRIPYSDAEKTLLDFIYLKRRGRIKAIPPELAGFCSKSKAIAYARHYGDTVKKEAEEIYGKKRIH